MVTYASSVINTRLQAVVNAVDSAGVSGSLVIYDALNTPLITFMLGTPSGHVANAVLKLNNAISKASAGGMPASAQLLNGVGSYVATLNIPSDLVVAPLPIQAGELAAVSGTITGN